MAHSRPAWPLPPRPTSYFQPQPVTLQSQFGVSQLPQSHVQPISATSSSHGQSVFGAVPKPALPQQSAQNPPACPREPSPRAGRAQEYLQHTRHLSQEEARAAFTASTRFDPASLERGTPRLTSENLGKMANTTTDYSDFDRVSNRVAALTVEKIKNILKHYQAKFHVFSKYSGRKADFVDRLRSLLEDAKTQQLADRYEELVRCINNPELCTSHSSVSRTTTTTAAPAFNYTAALNPTASTSTASQSAVANLPPRASTSASTSAAPPAPAAARAPMPSYTRLPSTAAAFGNASTSARLPPAPAPARVPPPVAAVAPPIKTITWKPNIFYNVVRQLCDPLLCPKAAQGDRKSSVVHFMLTEDDRTKILAGRASPANPQYQVRLFCTSEAYYSPPYSSYPSWRPNTANCQPAGPAYVEFPAQSEVRVNGQLLSVNLRGIKKKEGSTMPPDLSKPPGTSPVPALNMGATYTNRAELVYTNSPEKRFYLTACLIVYLSPEKAVASIKAKPQQPRDITIKQILAANDDPDIIADSFSLSLKCPLTYMRMVLPCKASTCVHVQCFDAASFLAMAEANPYFQCPHCSKIIDGETLVIDAFTADILGQVPSKYDSVVVDCDATWHTEDYKFGTSKKPDTFKAPVEVVEDVKPVRQGSKAVEILDSDDDEDYSTPPVSKSTASGRGSAVSSGRSPAPPRAAPRQAGNVIDLTQSDSDDEVVPAVVNQNNKRLGDDLVYPYGAQRGRWED